MFHEDKGEYALLEHLKIANLREVKLQFNVILENQLLNFDLVGQWKGICDGHPFYDRLIYYSLRVVHF